MMTRFLLMIPILVCAGCSRHEPAAGARGAQQTATPVQVETVVVSPVTETYRATGTIRARQVAVISSKISANILEVRVRAGDRVQAGQTIVQLDRRDLDAALRRAEAARAEVENAVAEAESAIASARASVDLARVTHKRFQDLLAKASVSQQEFDESQARLRTAEAELAIATSRRRQVEARRSQADAEVAGSRVSLGYATLAAPFAGLVTERKADPGTLTTPGEPLLTIEREGDLRLETSIDESRVGLVQPGEIVPIEIDGLNRRVNGRVGEIVSSIDTVSRTFIAKIDLPAVPGLRTGMFGHGEFAAGKRDALFVPDSAVLERGQIRCVHVVEGETARLRFVTVGEVRGNSREILSGLTPGERIVVAPPPLLADGGRVAIQQAAK